MEKENSNEKAEDDTRETEGEQAKEESQGERVRDSENKGTTTRKASEHLSLTSTEVDILEQFAGVCVFTSLKSSMNCLSEGGNEERRAKFINF